MYAIVQIGSGQYKISKGDVITVDRLAQKEGKVVNLDKVILISEGKNNVEVGTPYLKNIKVSADILRHFDGKKKVAFKYNRRKHYFKKHGFRQLLTEIKIRDISEKEK